MFPVRLTDNHYVHPQATAHVEYIPKGRLGEEAFFTVVFVSSQLAPVHLKGPEAEEAFENWNAAVARKKGPSTIPTAAPVQSPNE